MKNLKFPLSFSCLVASFLLLPVVKAGNNVIINDNKVVTESVVSDAAALEREALSLYEELELDKLGLNKQAMLMAYKGQDKMVDRGMVPNSSILTVIDFSQPSSRKRMYIIDLDNREVLVNTYVSHGRNSGVTYAERFSNRHESLQSSLGFYVTKHTYFGKHGLSLRLSGKDRGFNDNAESRAIVVHGANYIGENRLGSSYMGRSWGCPAVPQRLASKVINLIKNGTTMFIYHPSQKYLNGSSILNS